MRSLNWWRIFTGFSQCKTDIFEQFRHSAFGKYIDSRIIQSSAYDTMSTPSSVVSAEWLTVSKVFGKLCGTTNMCDYLVPSSSRMASRVVVVL